MLRTHDKLKYGPNMGNILRIGAIAMPWLCAAVFPILRIEGFHQSPLRMLFFEFAMVPFGNIAMLGMTANGQDRTFGLAAVFFLAGVILPPVIALLFARYWRRWQFSLVWLGYVALLAWDTILATSITVILVKGGIRPWL